MQAPEWAVDWGEAHAKRASLGACAEVFRKHQITRERPPDDDVGEGGKYA